MVDLPGVPRRLVTTEQTNFASPELAGAPMRILADALDSVGQKVEQAGLPAMEAAGERAVSIGPDGLPKVTLMSGLTATSQAYNRGAKIATMARLSGAVDAKLQELRAQHAGDAAGFKAVGDQYAEKIATNMAQDDPVLAGPAKLYAQQAVDQHHLGIIKDTQEKDIKSQNDAVKTRISDLDDKMIALARQKGGIDTPAFKSAASEYEELLTHQVKSPFSILSMDKAKSMIANVRSRTQAEATVGDIDEIYQKDGFAAAQAEAEKRLWDPSLSLSPTERRQAQEAVMGHIRIQEAERRVDLQQTKAIALAVPAEIAGGATYRPEDVEDLAGQLEKLGDPGGAARFRLEANKALTTRGLSQLNLHDRAQAREQLVFGGAAADPNDSAVLTKFLAPGKDAESVTGMAAPLQTGLASMLRDAPPEIQKSLSIFSGFRSDARQKELWDAAVTKYGSEEAARKWVAPPGHSQHNKGAAADLAYDGAGTTSKLTEAGQAAMEWAHANAAKYGLVFPLANEPWHVEAAGARGTAPRYGGQAAAATGGSADDVFGRMIHQESSGDPGALSPKGAQGLTQLMPATARETAREMGINLPQSDEALYTFFKTPAGQAANLKIGRAYFDKQLKTFNGDTEAAVIAYNAGPGLAQKWIAEGRVDTALPKETRDYRNKVLGGSGRGSTIRQGATTSPSLSFDPSLVAGVVAGTKKDFDTAFPAMQSAVAKGQPLSDDDGETLKSFAPFLSVDDRNKVRALIMESAGMQGMVGGFGQPGMSATQRQSLLNEVDLRISQGADAPQRAMADHFRTVDAQLTEEEKNDPYGRAVKGQWIKPGPPLDLANPASVAARGRDMQLIAQRLAQPGLGIFRPAEATSLAAQFTNMQPQQAAAAVGILYQNLDRATYMATMKQLHDVDPNSSIPWAGSLYRYAPSVAESIIAGEKALTANPKLAPPRDDQDTADKTSEVLPAAMLTGGGAAGYVAITQAARARYADLSFRAGDVSGKLSELRWEQSLNDVTGGILTFQGEKIIAPVPGMSQRQFDDRLKGLTDDDLFGAVTPNGKPFTASIIATGYGKATPGAGKAWMATSAPRFYPKLQSVADGQYIINMGTTEAPMIVQRKVTDAHDLGGPFVLDLRSK